MHLGAGLPTSIEARVEVGDEESTGQGQCENEKEGNNPDLLHLAVSQLSQPLEA